MGERTKGAIAFTTNYLWKSFLDLDHKLQIIILQQNEPKITTKEFD